MPWTTPNTAVGGGVWSASDYNQYVRDNLNYVHAGKPAVAIARNNGSNYTPGTSFADIDAANLSITLSTTTGRVRISTQCTFQSAAVDNMTCSLDVAVDGARRGGTLGITRAAVSNGVNAVGFDLLVTGLSTGSHTFRLQAAQSYGATPGVILSGTAAFVHFSVFEV